MSEERWTEAKVFERIAAHWPQPAYTTLPGVRNSTGASHVVRTADAIVASTWPSRGLWLAGVEIKVSPYDWQLELKKPEKSAEIQRYCHYWWIATPPGIVDLTELPETWGLIEVQKASTKIVKQAPRLEPVAIDMLFLGSILRSVAAASVPVADVDERVNAKVARELADRDTDTRRHNAAVAAFEKAYGGKLYDYAAEEAGQLAGAIQKAGLNDVLQRVKWLTKSLTEAATACADAAKGLGIELEEKKPRRRTKAS